MCASEGERLGARMEPGDEGKRGRTLEKKKMEKPPIRVPGGGKEGGASTLGLPPEKGGVSDNFCNSRKGGASYSVGAQ